jgi:uncharacterized membrane protein
MEKIFLFICLAGIVFSYIQADKHRDDYTYHDGKERPFEIWFAIMFIFIIGAATCIGIIAAEN